jgi:N-dimethylarginine dimethylaminohydrolase
MNTGCPSTVDALAQRGLRAVETATDEFIKAGGSVKCLVLMLDAFERWATDASES